MGLEVAGRGSWSYEWGWKWLAEGGGAMSGVGSGGQREVEL